MSLVRIAILFLALLISLTGCQKSPEDARRELGQLGIQYTPDAFIEAVKNKDTLAAKLFLAARMDPNTKDHEGNTVLMWAACRNDVEVMQNLLDRDADVHAKK